MFFKNILVPTDLSEGSAAAYPYAVALARSLGAKVTLLFVDELASFEPDDAAEARGFLARVEVNRSSLLAEAVDYFGQNNMSATRLVRKGVPSEQILEQQRKGQSDLIIMCRRSQGPVAERLLFGSTTKRVVHQADIPVLVVPRFSNGELWIEPPALRRILATTDFGTDSARGLRATMALAGELNAEVTLAHVVRIPRGETAAEHKDHSPVPRIFFVPLLLDAEAGLELAAKNVGPVVPKTVLLRHLVVGQGLVDAAETCADLIVMPTRGKGTAVQGFLGSTADSVLRRTARPALVLPRAYLSQNYGG